MTKIIFNLALLYNFATLKNLFILFFLSVYIISATELHQLVKLPFLVHHYFEHKEKDSISLQEFLHLHYSTHHQNENDYNDKRLPFKSHENSVNINLSPLFFSIPSGFSLSFSLIKIKLYPLYSDNFSSSAFISSIWQPPKSC